ncbi:hypothetical protein D3C75_600020 [compost metagenome]
MYCLLQALKSPFLQSTITTIKLLAADKVFFLNSTQRSHNNCKTLIQSLAQKQLIAVTTIEGLAVNSRLLVTFPSFNDGYERIDVSLWNQVSTPDELVVLYFLKRFTGFQKAKEAWSDVLGYSSKKTGINIVNKMELEGKIYYVEGEKYTDQQGRIKQKPTKWYLGKPEVMEHPLPETIVHDELAGFLQGVRDTDSSPVSTDPNFIMWGHWKSGNLDDTDYDLYVQQKDNDEFMTVAERKINLISKNRTNDKVAFAINKAIEAAEERYRKQKQLQQRKEESERENKIITLINDSEITLIERGGDIIPLDINNVQNTDKLLYIDEAPGPFTDTVIEKVKGEYYRSFVNGNNGYSQQFIYPETLEQLKQIAKKLLTISKFSSASIIVMHDERQGLFDKLNANRSYDVPHDGDEVLYDQSGEENLSLKERVRKHNKTAKTEQTPVIVNKYAGWFANEETNTTSDEDSFFTSKCHELQF